MANWVLAADGDNFVNLDMLPVATINVDFDVELVVPAGDTYKLAGSPFASQADAVAAFQAAVATPVPPTATFSGTVTY